MSDSDENAIPEARASIAGHKRPIGYAVGAAALWGIAAGLIAYRLGMLPLDWDSSARHIVTGIAIGFIFAGRQLILGRDKPVVPMLGSALAGLALGFGLMYVVFPTLGRAPLSKRYFPGFELSLPKGDVLEQSTDYAMGKFMLKNVGGVSSAIVIQWEPGKGMTPDELKMVASIFGGVIPELANTGARVTTIPGPDGKPVDTIVLGEADSGFELSMLSCGNRQVLVGVGARHDTHQLHTRVVASFVCKPDAAKEQAAGTFQFPYIFDMPGWYVSDKDPQQFQITDGANGIITMRPLNKTTKLEIEKILLPMFQAAGMADAFKLGDKVGDRSNFTLTENGETVVGFARTISCAEANAMFIVIANDQAGADDLYIKISNGHCKRPDEPVQTWPDPPPGAVIP